MTLGIIWPAKEKKEDVRKRIKTVILQKDIKSQMSKEVYKMGCQKIYLKMYPSNKI